MRMRIVVAALIALLIVLHQDYWQWNKADLVLGFLPYTIAYHAALSLAAAGVWLLAVHFCWPEDADSPAPANEPQADRGQA